MNQSLKPLAQEEAWSKLVKMASALPQGLILVGPPGIGKRRAVKALFQHVSCVAVEPRAGLAATEPCGVCVMCRKIAEDKHADYIEIVPKGDTIAVDDLREMKKTLYFAPLEGRLRFIVIDEAHKLNGASANTLLKTLEEPPTHTRFFLVTHERGLLLPTIVSRCQFIHFAPLSREATGTLLAKMGIELPPALKPLCLDLLAGGLARAALLADDKTLGFLEQAERALGGIKGGRWDQVVGLADELSGEDWKLELFLDMIVRFSHRKAVASHGSAETYAHADLALAATFLRRRLERHANKKLVALAAAELATGDRATGEAPL